MLRAPAENLEQALYVSDNLPTGRIMVKDEDVCLHCGSVRRAMPDRRLGHAEIHVCRATGGSPACQRHLDAYLA